MCEGKSCPSFFNLAMRGLFLALSSSNILSVLVHLGCYNKNTIDWIAYKHQKSISHHTGVWKLKIKILSVKMSGEGLFHINGILLLSLHPYMKERARKLLGLSLSLLNKGTKSFLRDPTS